MSRQTIPRSIPRTLTQVVRAVSQIPSLLKLPTLPAVNKNQAVPVRLLPLKRTLLPPTPSTRQRALETTCTYGDCSRAITFNNRLAENTPSPTPGRIHGKPDAQEYNNNVRYDQTGSSFQRFSAPVTSSEIAASAEGTTGDQNTDDVNYQDWLRNSQRSKKLKDKDPPYQGTNL